MTATELLPGIKLELDITWDDPKTDTKVLGIIGRGISYLDHKAGVPQDYATEGKARELLIEYCKYARSNMLANFMKDYLHELIAFQIGAS